uniref:Uncharacterized protein n=1 Tax=Corethron hystrix TaxID=216773 RepID=A0A7S1BWW7_9STRA|mmetsp:Transcript_5143/g.10377  ORF Transcript_5143/g.10377 Transcript_5143/m.10377 type:complete len:220 (+) Transcript_5143:710-1369(+)
MASTSTKAFSGSAVSPSVERVDAATHLAIQVLPSASSETRSKQINAYNTSALSLLAGASSSHDEVMTSDEPKPPQSSSLANQRCPLDALATLASSAATLDSDAKNTSCSETRHRDRSYSNPEGFEKFSNLYATASSFNPSLSTIDCDGEDVEMDGSEDQIQTKSDSELLRNTRSRILEDLDEERASRGGKGVVTLPHMLAKYSQVSVTPHNPLILLGCL